MLKNTRKAERLAHIKARRKVIRAMRAHQKAKRKGLRTFRTHPHRKTSALRARERA